MLRLVRKSSDLPNVSNRDDACLSAYAYGGVRGVVSSYGQELSSTLVNGNELFINSGRIVIDGWEIDVEEEIINIPYISHDTMYEYLYVELNLLTENAVLKTIRSSTEGFPLSDGENLTRYPSGTARYLLYSWKVFPTSISTPVSEFTLLHSYRHHIDLIYERLEKLGFKEGNILPAEGVTIMTESIGEVLIQSNWLKRQGNYVIGEYCCFTTGEFPELDSTIAVKRLIGTVPTNFVPQNSVTQRATIVSELSGAYAGEVSIDNEGKITFYEPINALGRYHTVYLQIGYEAKPIGD